MSEWCNSEGFVKQIDFNGQMQYVNVWNNIYPMWVKPNVGKIFQYHQALGYVSPT